MGVGGGNALHAASLYLNRLGDAPGTRVKPSPFKRTWGAGQVQREGPAVRGVGHVTGTRDEQARSSAGNSRVLPHPGQRERLHEVTQDGQVWVKPALRLHFLAQDAEGTLKVRGLVAARNDDLVAIVDMAGGEGNHPGRAPHLLHIQAHIPLVHVTFPKALVRQHRLVRPVVQAAEGVHVLHVIIVIAQLVLDGVIRVGRGVLDARRASIQRMHADEVSAAVQFSDSIQDLKDLRFRVVLLPFTKGLERGVPKPTPSGHPVAEEQVTLRARGDLRLAIGAEHDAERHQDHAPARHLCQHGIQPLPFS